MKIFVTVVVYELLQGSHIVQQFILENICLIPNLCYIGLTLMKAEHNNNILLRMYDNYNLNY